MRTHEDPETIVLEPMFGNAGDYLLTSLVHEPLDGLSLVLVRYGDEDDVAKVRLTDVEFFSAAVQNFSLIYEFEMHGSEERPCIGRATDSQSLRQLRSGPNFYGLELDRLQHVFILGGEMLLDVILTGDVEISRAG